jgi:hypothetical protein
MPWCSCNGSRVYRFVLSKAEDFIACIRLFNLVFREKMKSRLYQRDVDSYSVRNILSFVCSPKTEKLKCLYKSIVHPLIRLDVELGLSF